MSIRVLLIALLCGTTVSSTAVRRIRPQAARASVVAITDVTIIDVNATDPSSARRTRQTVLFDRGEIKDVGPAANVRTPSGAQRVDGRNGYLIPGLWDAHGHVSQAAGASGLAAYVANGITTVRDLGGRISDAITWQE